MIYGADPQDLRDLAKVMQAKADSIEHSAARITALIGQPIWEGARATQFQRDWYANGRRLMNGAAAMLRTAARRADSNAAEQERTSSGSSGTTRPTPIVLPPGFRVTPLPRLIPSPFPGFGPLPSILPDELPWQRRAWPIPEWRWWGNPDHPFYNARRIPAPNPIEHEWASEDAKEVVLRIHPFLRKSGDH